MKKFCLALALLVIFATSAFADDNTIYSNIPVPTNDIRATDFFISSAGTLAVNTENGTMAYIHGHWELSNATPANSSFSIRGKSKAFSIYDNDELIFSDQLMQSIYPVDTTLAYGISNNKVYQINMQTGQYEAICYVNGWESDDWAEQILYAENTIYVIQTRIPLIQSINLSNLSTAESHTLRIAVACEEDIGNVVLSTAEERYISIYPNALIDTVRLSSDQLRLSLMDDPTYYDLIICDCALWNDLAQAGIFENLEAHVSLQEAWKLWIDMSSLCRYKNILMGVPLWDHCQLLWVNNTLSGYLSDVQWPNSTWTWNDFLDLARDCCQDLNGDGVNDIYIAYQRMFYADWNTTKAYSLPVHQAALLYQNDVITDMQSPEILNMLTIWKTCIEENLVYMTDGSYSEPNASMVVFAQNMPAEWCEYVDVTDIRLTMPGLSDSVYCNPADSVLMSINAYSKNLEYAVCFMEAYMRYGADEHNYLKTNTYTPTNLLPYQNLWQYPSEFHDEHFEAALQNAYRDTWEESLYEDMENSLLRYVTDEITAEQCAYLWQEKLRMIDMK